MVMAPASTGITPMMRKPVISQAQANMGIFISDMPGARMLSTVAMTLMAPMMDEIPIKWTEKITNGKDIPCCSISGGYMVQPPAGPPPGMNRVDSKMAKANGSSQNDQLFMRGSAMSGAPIMMGIIQLASPVKAGMTAPKIMTRACSVVIWLKK